MGWKRMFADALANFRPDNLGSLVIMVSLAIIVVFAPTAIAILRHHPNRRLIAAVNFPALFSWIAWLGILIWAITGRRSATIEKLLRNRDKKGGEHACDNSRP